jgi:hypothetical protein
MRPVVAMCRRPAVSTDDVRRALVEARDEFAAVAALAADPDEPIAVRVVALAAVVEAASVCDLAVPDVLAEAVDDLALVDACVARGARRRGDPPRWIGPGRPDPRSHALPRRAGSAGRRGRDGLACRLRDRDRRSLTPASRAIRRPSVVALAPRQRRSDRPRVARGSDAQQDAVVRTIAIGCAK